ncbi:hypothetical protein Bcav_3913 [Beutenbergia cavernae DSM 12333]|uniref:Uncharacterized protein n=1 Tax=Beutenbergia cavernae (strain ATCC BAA-8 / DSM 12333 / CCUG 43141 / JCM 11478 / NBRC 16432 / NCIMB 13614 / HKI 0122) TaxID=471853 RepID=C5C4N0_BEUC1|nr:hypothetical protein [Beutenbergia cavernae]ACQ82154.1 hypothetical protein Bcav_3913 [Beutenbergia cavernae DSM 12333]
MTTDDPTRAAEDEVSSPLHGVSAGAPEQLEAWRQASDQLDGVTAVLESSLEDRYAAIADLPSEIDDALADTRWEVVDEGVNSVVSRLRGIDGELIALSVLCSVGDPPSSIVLSDMSLREAVPVWPGAGSGARTTAVEDDERDEVERLTDERDEAAEEVISRLDALIGVVSDAIGRARAGDTFGVLAKLADLHLNREAMLSAQQRWTAAVGALSNVSPEALGPEVSDMIQGFAEWLRNQRSAQPK